MFNIHAPGTRIETSAGTVEIVKDINAGGEGQGYQAKHKGRMVFYKAFHKSAVPPYSPAQTMELRRARTKWLVESGLHLVDERINAPFAYSKEGGYVCSWIEGLLPLYCEPEDGPCFLGSLRPYVQRVGVLGQIADLLELAHARGISHGDVNSENIGVVVKDDAVLAYLIDWSNFFNGDTALPPLMAGSEASMAWWVRSKGEYPDRRSDVYSLAIHGHELLLGRPVVAGCGSVPEMLQRLERGDLPGDPLRGRGLAGDEVGVPFEALAPELQSQFRSMLQPRKESVPPIEAFSRALRTTLPNLTACPSCNTPLWWYAGRSLCPKCRQPLGPALNLVVSGRSVPVNGVILLGRSELGGDAAISETHLRIHPLSPGRGHLTVLGRNGVKRQRGKERVRAEQGQDFDIVPGDQVEVPTQHGVPVLLEVA